MFNRQLWIKIRTGLIQAVNFIGRVNPITIKRLTAAMKYIKSSWKSIAIILPAFLVLYYVVGSWATHNIDKTSDIEIVKPAKGLAVAEASAWLIRREVDDKMWTPNLPLIFPGYVLDDMPAYQLGIMQTVKDAAKILAQNYDSDNLKRAAKLLSYPGNIWLLSKTENLALAPSSGAQYRKARKALMRFNEEDLTPKAADRQILITILSAFQKNAATIDSSLEKQVRENSSTWFDMQADNVFYLNQGRLYGNYVLFKALAEDFKPQILSAGQYEAWTSLLKTLSDGFNLNPFMVRNGEPDSSFAPNHLMVLNFYAVKARFQLNQIIAALKQDSSSEEKNK